MRVLALIAAAAIAVRGDVFRIHYIPCSGEAVLAGQYFNMNAPFEMGMDVVQSSNGGVGGIFNGRYCSDSTTCHANRLEISFDGDYYQTQSCTNSDWGACSVENQGWDLNPTIIGDTYMLKVVYTGDTVTWYVNGAEVQTHPATGTGFGFFEPEFCNTYSGGWGGWTGDIMYFYFDDLVESAPLTSAPTLEPVASPTPYPTPSDVVAPGEDLADCATAISSTETGCRVKTKKGDGYYKKKKQKLKPESASKFETIDEAICACVDWCMAHDNDFQYYQAVVKNLKSSKCSCYGGKIHKYRTSKSNTLSCGPVTTYGLQELRRVRA